MEHHITCSQLSILGLHQCLLALAASVPEGHPSTPSVCFVSICLYDLTFMKLVPQENKQVQVHFGMFSNTLSTFLK